MENASFMKKMLMMVAIAMMTTVVLTSCEKDDDSDDWEPSLPSQRTVMVYMAAKNNLAIAASNDISEMEEGMVEVPANSTVVLFVDTCQGICLGALGTRNRVGCYQRLCTE